MLLRIVSPAELYPKTKRLFRPLTVMMIAAFSGFFPTYAQHECCGAGGGGGIPGMPTLETGGEGIAGLDALGDAAACEIDDTSKVSVSTFGLFSYGTTEDGHRADPLGTGGKPPISLLTSLYRESSDELPSLSRRDLRVQYGDAGYIPIWRNNVMVTSVRAKLNDEFTGKVGISYGGELGQPGTAQGAGQFGLGEVALIWKPSRLDGFTLKGGNILDVGYFLPAYNQSPVENFIYTGLMASYVKSFADLIAGSIQVSGGGTMNNLVTFRDTLVPPAMVPSGLQRSTRNRTYLGTKLGITIASAWAIKLSAGYQFIPQDSAAVVPQSNIFSREYRKSEGWFTGVETNLKALTMNHSVSAVYAFGDALTGSGAPDYVRYVSFDTAGYVRDVWFSREKSKLLSLGYGAGWKPADWFSLSGGVWGMFHQPDPNPIVESNLNLASYNSIYDWEIDSLTKSTLFEGNAVPLDSTVTLEATPWTVVKYSIMPSFKVIGPLHLGCRVDKINYLNPDAHLNTQEPIRDQTLRPDEKYKDIPRDIYGPSKWEREAVNALIVTPQVALVFENIGGFSVSASQAYYDAPVDRQGRIADKHFNVVLSAFLNYHFKR